MPESEMQWVHLPEEEIITPPPGLSSSPSSRYNLEHLLSIRNYSMPQILALDEMVSQALLVLVGAKGIPIINEQAGIPNNLPTRLPAIEHYGLLGGNLIMRISSIDQDLKGILFTKHRLASSQDYQDSLNSVVGEVNKRLARRRHPLIPPPF